MNIATSIKHAHTLIMNLKILILLICLATLRVACDDDKEEVDEENNPYYNDFGDRNSICPFDKKCIDGKRNFLCRHNAHQLSKHCKRFKMMPVTPQSRAHLVNMHNGLRNKLAYDERLANMNLVYWNIHLQHMAEQYLNLCRPYRDKCLRIGKDGYIVGHNTLFIPSRRVSVQAEWEARTLRFWFIKIGSNVESFQDMLNSNDIEPNLNQLIWPSLEFIGCSAAIMFDGFFVVCYYYPNITQKLRDEVTYLGEKETCVCPEKRLLCSQVFTSLCGIDLNIFSSTRPSFNELFSNYFIYIMILKIYHILRY